MTNEILTVVTSVLGITEEEAKVNCKEIPELDAWYFWSSGRGGRAMIINGSAERLIATSAVKYEDHIKAFASGRRN